MAEIRGTTELKERSLRGKRNVMKETTRHGKVIYYYRKNRGQRIRLPDPAAGMTAFNQAYLAASRGIVIDHPTQVRDRPKVSLTIGNPGFVYFLRMGDAVKIGFSKDVGKRLTTIQTSCPEPAQIITVIPGSDQTERYFHAHFAAYRQSGEWFRLEGAVATFLASAVKVFPGALQCV